jgi:hypothetical protein
VAHPVGELRLEADLTRRVKVEAGFLLGLAALPDGLLQHLDFVLLFPATKKKYRVYIY